MTPELLELTLRATLEAICIAAAFWIMLFPLGAARHLARLGPRRLLALTLMMGLWVTVQLADRGQYFYPQPASFYPAARFAMYEAGEPRETIPSYRLAGRFPDGTTREINLATFFPSVDVASLDSRMLAVSAGLRSADPEMRLRAERELEGFVAGIRSILADRNEPRPVVVAFHSTRHRITDRALVRDTVPWSASSRAAGDE